MTLVEQGAPGRHPRETGTPGGPGTAPQTPTARLMALQRSD